MCSPKALLPLLVAALLLASSVSDARLLRSQTAGFAPLPYSLSGFAATTASSTATAAGE
jgi:hypothetical protein